MTPAGPAELHGGEVADDSEVANGHPTGVARGQNRWLLNKIESSPTRERRGGPKAILKFDQVRCPTKRYRDLKFRQDAAPAGVGGPGAALQRHQRCSRRWPPVRWCWVGGRSRSGGRASAATARSCGSSVARCARRRGVRRRCPGRCTVGRAARRGSRGHRPPPCPRRDSPPRRRARDR